MKYVFFAVSVFLATAAISQSNTIVGQATAIDGDTIEIHGTRIRFHGMDAPERSQPCYDENGEEYRCGPIAANALDEMIGGQVVSCDPVNTDRYGRVVAVCSVKGADLGELLVIRGLAVAYPLYSDAYIPAEIVARIRHIGLWRGEFELALAVATKRITGMAYRSFRSLWEVM